MEALAVFYRTIITGYPETLQTLHKNSLSKSVNEIKISALINFNRELYTFFKSTLYGRKDYLLSLADAGYFGSLPVFIK